MADEPLKLRVAKRLQSEGRWSGPGGGEAERDRIIGELRGAGLSKEEAQERCYPILDRLFPPMPKADSEAEQSEPDGDDDPDFLGFTGNVDDLIDPSYSEPDAGCRLRDAYIWVGDEFRRITRDMPDGKTRQEFTLAKSRPPTPLAVSIAEYYGEHRAKRGEMFARLAQFAQKQHDPQSPPTPEDESGFIGAIA